MEAGWRAWGKRAAAGALVIAMAAFALGAAAPVNEKEAASRPAAVTVYPDAARVEREGEVDLPAGPALVTFTDLPAAADEASLRVSVRGPAGTKFHGVRMRTAFASKAVERRVQELNDRIRELGDRAAEIDDRLTGRSAELEILKALARGDSGKTTTGGTLGQLAEGSKAVGKRIQELLAESRKDTVAKRDLDEQAGVYRRELAQAGAGRTDRRVAEVELTVGKPGKVEFTIAYLVHNAQWSPVYDITLDGAAKQSTVAIAFAATVRQQSGEDWTNVALTLSTARPTADSRIPDPTNWWLDLWKPEPVTYRKVSRRAGMFAPEAPAARPSMAEAASADETPVEVAMEEARVEQAAFATHFRIPSPATILSGGEARRVGIAESAHPADLTLVAVPRLALAAFVEAKVEYGADEPLLPGTANLFQGGEFVGTVAIPSVGPGETITLGFGQDPNVKVERKLRDTKEADSVMLGLGKASRRYRWVTTLTGTHQAVRTIEVREQLPRSRHAEVTVEAMDMSPEPLAEAAATPGLKRFRVELKPGKPTQVVFGYVVKFPQGSRVTGME